MPFFKPGDQFPLLACATSNPHHEAVMGVTVLLTCANYQALFLSAITIVDDLGVF